ncbi:MAG: hypothetical protein KUF75_07795 [Candidatus Thiodiazotropha sp. (ex Ctena orbiculata)]|nr:hypothetical protein [Candidatus Thiodiazotropha taylori]
MTEDKIVTTLTPQQEYGVYLSDCAFPTAQTIDPMMLENGVSELTTKHLKELEGYQKLLIIGITEKSESEGEDDDQ